MNKKIAWAIIAGSEDQYIACRHFYEQMKCLHSKYEVLILVTEDLDLDYWNKLNIPYIIVPQLKIDNYYCYNKFNIWNLIDYDLICFFETDLFLLKNIDFIIDANINYFFDTKSPVFFYKSNKFNNGVSCLCIIAKPNRSIYNNLITYSKINPVLDDYLYYNFFKAFYSLTLEDIVKNLFNNISEYILHFPGTPKLWEINYTNSWKFFSKLFKEDYNNYIQKHKDWLIAQWFLNIIIKNLSYDIDLKDDTKSNTIKQAENLIVILKKY